MIILFYLNYFGITHLVLLINTFCLTPPPPPPSWTEFVLFIRCLVLVEMLLLPSQNRKYGTFTSFVLLKNFTSFFHLPIFVFHSSFIIIIIIIITLGFFKGSNFFSPPKTQHLSAFFFPSIFHNFPTWKFDYYGL